MPPLIPPGKARSYFSGNGLATRDTGVGSPPARARVEKFDVHAGDSSRSDGTNAVLGSDKNRLQSDQKGHRKHSDRPLCLLCIFYAFQAI